MNINLYNNEDEIHFITQIFKDRTEKYILMFRKYILNLSTNNSNKINKIDNDNDYNIYHIIIPKNKINNIEINFNEKMDINNLLSKINSEYFFYVQKPGELLIVEPGSLHLTYYKKSKNLEKQEKNYLLMFWNKMNINSFNDYLALQNDCKNEGYKYFPILTMLFNLVNKKMKFLSGYYIQTIREIYNEIDSYENINKYINEINDNNIFFHKLFLNNIDLCYNCKQEIFNYYFYCIEKNEKENERFLCINCAHKKKYFSIKKSIIFFKYTKDELESFVNIISSQINNKNRKVIEEEDTEDEEIISKCFDFKNREDDCVNIDEFILKINGPLKVINKDYNNNNNYHLMNNIKVDKYLLFLENDKLDNPNQIIDPLDKKNFKNDLTENDIYGKIKNPKGISMKNNILNNNNIGNKNELLNINKIEYEINNDNSRKQSMRTNIINNNKIKNQFINNENKNVKNKKKKEITMSDLIANGMF